MSDSYFIGTVGRVHNLERFGPGSKSISTPKTTRDSSSEPATSTQTAAMEKQHPRALLEAKESTLRGGNQTSQRRVSIMVSLDHSIYFHRRRDLRADEWLFSEMNTPWAGDGRGLVLQRIWNRKGQLVATCVQEGLIRLEQAEPAAKL